MRNRSVTCLAAAFAVACGHVEPSEFARSTLEAAVVSVDVDFASGNRRDFVGTLAVSGGDRDWRLTVDTSSTDSDIDVHTPSAADLSLLDGATDVRVTVERDPASGELSLGLSDATTREVAYLLEPTGPGLLSADLFGAGLLGRGEGLGEVEADVWDLELSSGLLRTDTGDVELLPGEPQAVTIGGVTYRAVLLASYEAELRLDDAPNCSGARERLAFELLRAEDPDLAPITRPAEEALPTASCGA